MTPVMTTPVQGPRNQAVHQQERLSVSDLIAERDLTPADCELIFRLSERVKSAPGLFVRALQGKQLALIFEKPSLRTRVAFEVGMTSLGGSAVYLDHTQSRLGERESTKDIARNLERWVDGIAARTFAHASVAELAEYASIPVINALSDLYHPCQALADFFTLREKFGSLKRLRLAFVGDGNNVCHSMLTMAAKCGTWLRVATPPGFEPKAEVVEEAKAFAQETGATIEFLRHPVEAVAGARAVYTDVWTSMGQEDEADLRKPVFAPYQVTEELMAAADPTAAFMHCLPAHRGEEVVDAVIDSLQSIVYDQAENRLHVQKALLMLLLLNGQR